MNCNASHVHTFPAARTRFMMHADVWSDTIHTRMNFQKMKFSFTIYSPIFTCPVGSSELRTEVGRTYGKDWKFQPQWYHLELKVYWWKYSIHRLFSTNGLLRYFIPCSELHQRRLHILIKVLPKTNIVNEIYNTQCYW